jgi:hypothetical protein
MLLEVHSVEALVNVDGVFSGHLLIRRGRMRPLFLPSFFAGVTMPKLGRKVGNEF